MKSLDRLAWSESSKSYCPESNSTIEHFGKLYAKQLRGSTVIRDGGLAYKSKEVEILAHYCRRVAIMWSEPHGEMSIWDNSLNAEIKSLLGQQSE